MSLKRHTDALLDGFLPPVFPKSPEGLVAIPGSFSWHEYDNVSRGMPGYVKSARFKTSDGYDWFCCLIFDVRGSQVCIALPWHQDWAKSDGYESDRSPAVYLVVPAVSPEEVDALIELLTVKLKEYKAEYDRKLKEQSPSSLDV